MSALFQATYHSDGARLRGSQDWHARYPSLSEAIISQGDRAQPTSPEHTRRPPASHNQDAYQADNGHIRLSHIWATALINETVG